MKEYSFITPGLFKGVTANEAAAELERIKEKRGVLSPEVVVEESEADDSVLHQCFVWDDTKAARLYRETQARKLIGNIRVVIKNELIETPVRAFVNVRQDVGLSRSYIPITEAIVNDKAYADLLAQAKEDMEDFISKYAQITELNEVKAEMLKALRFAIPAQSA